MSWHRRFFKNFDQSDPDFWIIIICGWSWRYVNMSDREWTNSSVAWGVTSSRAMQVRTQGRLNEGIWWRYDPQSWPDEWEARLHHPINPNIAPFFILFYSSKFNGPPSTMSVSPLNIQRKIFWSSTSRAKMSKIRGPVFFRGFQWFLEDKPMLQSIL